MKKLLCIPLLLMFFSGLAFGQATIVPTCNGTSVGCTDYFGVGNWANSPLPAGTITGFTLITGGSGYLNPQIVITDPTGTGASGTATVTLGFITGFTVVAGGSGYIMPQVNIVDVGTGGTLAAPTCGGAGQPVCGSGALATAVLGGPFTGGMLKFQDPLIDLKTTIATADTTTFPGSDYYEIALVQYTQKMHASLPPSTIRGYVQLPTGSTACPAAPAPKYLGPTILAQKNRPVRVKFTNCLAAGAGGNLFIPVDSTYMGAGMGPDGTPYTQNRATLHLHGGATPWISDGTPHQWTVPAGEVTTHQRGDSTAFVPDMWFDATTHAVVPAGTAGATNDPGPGAMTFYWTNQQGGRLMFYHDHAYGITRLNVYAGEAAGYLLYDPVEEAALAAATAPGSITTGDLAHRIPLVIQDKSFVPSSGQLLAQDPTWVNHYGATAPLATGGNGDFWFPHVYMPNQNPADPTGGNAFGRWDYGAWFFPPLTTLTAATPATAVTVACTSAAFPGQTLAPSTACPTCGCPITPNPSGTPEAFGDTPVVNGVAFPVLHVAPEAYRFQMLAAGNDRSWHLSWFVADPANKTEIAMLPAVPPSATSVFPALGLLPSSPLALCPAINPVAVPSLIIGLDTGLLDATGNPLNGTGLWGTPTAPCWPRYGVSVANVPPIQQTMWAADGRMGGVPDPRTAGPAWIQIGTEGGLLPAPVVIPPTPVNYEQNTKSITITSVGVHGLWLGPAERADVIVDFSKAPAICAALGVSPCTLILYNDAPAPAPAIDTRLDYFTGDGDSSPIGGAPNTQPGYGPNTRTVMQVIVDGATTGQAAFSLPALQAAMPALFKSTQPPIIVPEPTYPAASGGYSATQSYATIQANSLTYTANSPQITEPCTPPAAGCVNLDQKAIQELFTLDYGRMNATMGTELPLTNFLTQTTIPYGYVDWPTEIIQDGNTQIWKITHNGVDSHFVHFHLFNVQVINRMGWDGSTRPPDANELGWKDTVRMNPLEDIVVALQPITPTFPFPLPDSIRAVDVTLAPGLASPALSGIDPASGNVGSASTINALVNFGWEYVWHCHILGHEENDMMRPIIHQVAPPAPSNLLANLGTSTPPLQNIVLTWTDNSASETSFTLQRSTTTAFLATDPGFASFPVDGTVAGSGFSTRVYGQTITFTDATGVAGTSYYYRVQANDSFAPNSPLAAPFQTVPMSSAWSNIASTAAGTLAPAVTFTGAPASAAYNTSFTVTATTNGSVMPTIGAAGVCTVGAVTGTPASAIATVTMTSGTGTCTLTANWAAAAPFSAGGPLTQTTTAALAVPTVAFTGAPATAAANATFTVTATSTAGVAPTISGTAGICSVGPVTGTSPATALVTMISAPGTCLLTASWAATANYAAASLTQTTTATLAAPTVSFTGAPASATVATPFTVTATTNASVAPTITGTGVCTVGAVTGTSPATATVTMTSGTGSCLLTASWPATTIYAAATLTQTTAAALATPTVTFTGAPASMVYLGSFTVTAATNAGVMPSITPNNPSACAVGPISGTSTGASASIIMTTGTGTCTLTASWPATTSYAAASLSQTTSALPLTPVTTFSGAPASAAYGSQFTVAATTDAGVMPTIAATAGVCTVSAVSGTPTGASATVIMTSGTGSCLLTASWPATATYAAVTKTQTTAAAKLASTTRIVSNTPSPSFAGQAVTVTYTVTGTAGLLLPTGNVTVSGGGTSCTASVAAGSCTLTFNTAGNVTLTATYVGDSNYNGSTSAGVTQSVRDFSISVSPTAPNLKGGQQQKYTVTVTSRNNFAGSITISGSSLNLPAGYTISAPVTVTLRAGRSASATITVNTVAGTPGTYNLTFTGTFNYTGGSLSHSANATIRTTT